MRLSILPLLLPFLFPHLSLCLPSWDPHNINQIDFLPSIRFNVHSTSNDIELQNINFPSKTILKFLLSNMELLSSEKNFIIHQIINAGETLFSRSVTFPHTRDSNIKFSQLNGGHTYYLYYLLLDESDSIIGPYLEVISTSQPFIISTIFWTLNPSILMDILVPIILFGVVIMLIRKFEEKCGKSEPKKETACCTKEVRNILYSLRPEFKIPLQNAQQDPLLLAKETQAKGFQTIANVSLQQEKNEVQRVIRRLEEENKEFEDRLMCEICCEKFREVIFLSCGHVYCCEKCAVELIVCPIDKSIIGSKFRFTMCDKYGIDVQLSPQIIASKLQSLDLLRFNYQNNSNALKAQEPTQMEKYLGLRIKNENYKLFSHCIICNERKKNVLFIHCNHLICCQKCAKDLKVCPLDGRDIFQKTTVFTA